MDVFNIHIEFDSKIFLETIDKCIKEEKKAYVCVVDASVVSRAQKDKSFRDIVKHATINTCDGSSIAMMVNRIYGTNYHAYNGPEVFEHYIELPFKHLLIGNTIEKVLQIKQVVKDKGKDVILEHLDVPFVSVDQFDYKSIASIINKTRPDIIWVSLGNPKQEVFMSNLLPLIDKGVMIGIGAAFNFYIGELHNRKKEIFGLRVIWLERMIKEPKKQIMRNLRVLSTMPKMFFEEWNKYKHNKE